MNQNLQGDQKAAHQLTPFEKKLLAWGKRTGRRDGEKGIFLEGQKLAEEALYGGQSIKAAFYTPDFQASHAGLISQIESRDARMVLVSARFMKSISEMETPPGIILVASEPGFIYKQPGDSFSLIVAVSMVQDPGNLGGVIRTADYFGVDEIWLGPGSADPHNTKSIRGTMGAVLRMPVIRVADLTERIVRFKETGAEIWASLPHDLNAELKIKPGGSRILLIGGESKGLSRKEAELADYTIRIPGARRSESLNLAVATGILIYSATSGRFAESIK